MRFKAGIKTGPVHPQLWYARGVVDSVFQEMVSRETVITSTVRAPTPGGSSLHELGLADDHRTRDLSTAQQRVIANVVGLRLGNAFDVVLEGPAAFDPKYRDRVAHLHVEYDPRVR